MTCSKGSGPEPRPRRVVLTVYFREAAGRVRSLYCEYTRSEAALRLKWARHLENFKGHAITEIAIVVVAVVYFSGHFCVWMRAGFPVVGQ